MWRGFRKIAIVCVGVITLRKKSVKKSGCIVGRAAQRNFSQFNQSIVGDYVIHIFVVVNHWYQTWEIKKEGEKGRWRTHPVVYVVCRHYVVVITTSGDGGGKRSNQNSTINSLIESGSHSPSHNWSSKYITKINLLCSNDPTVMEIPNGGGGGVEKRRRTRWWEAEWEDQLATTATACCQHTSSDADDGDLESSLDVVVSSHTPTSRVEDPSAAYTTHDCCWHMEHNGRQYWAGCFLLMVGRYCAFSCCFQCCSWSLHHRCI